MYVLSQVLVGVSDIFCLIAMLKKSKKNVVIYLLISTILFASHYMCLGGWTGAGICLVEIVFLLLMLLLESKGLEKYTKYLALVTIAVTVGISLLTWAGWISILPMIAMVVYLIGMIFPNVIIVKTGAFVRLFLNGIYMLILKSYFGAVLTIMLLAFTVIGIINDRKCKMKNLN